MEKATNDRMKLIRLERAITSAAIREFDETVALMLLIWRYGCLSHIFASASMIATQLNITEKRAKRILNSLIDSGCLVLQSGGGPDDWTSTYKIDYSAVSGLGESAPKIGTKVYRKTCPSVPKINTST